MSTTPLTSSQWTEALKAEGVNVIGYKSWTTHGRDSATGKTFGPANGVTIHHTAGRDSIALCYSGTSSLPGPLCHTHLAKDGVARMMSVRRANHAGSFAQNAHNAVLGESPVHPYPDSAEPVDGNDHYYGIEIENLGNGDDPYPLVQYQAAVRWATAICRFHGWTQDSVIGHKEGTRRKIDPRGPVQGGALFTMDRFRTHVKEALALPAGVWPNQEEDVALSAEDIKKVAAEVRDLLLRTDFQYKAPKSAGDYNDDPADSRHWWSGQTVHEVLVNSARDTEAKVDAVKAKVDSLSTGSIDLEKLATKVADKLAARLAD